MNILNHKFENTELWRTIRTNAAAGVEATVQFDQYSDGTATIKSEDLQRLLVRAGYQFSGIATERPKPAKSYSLMDDPEWVDRFNEKDG